MKKTALLFLVFSSAISLKAQDKIYNLIIGTYTNNCDSKGIYVYDFSTDFGDFALKNSTENIKNPSYLTVSSDSKNIYSVNENGENSTISAFSYNSKSGKIDLLNQQNSYGADPCFIIADEKNIIVANYSGGNISVFGIEKNGEAGNLKQLIQHEGNSLNKERQEKAHVHQVVFSPDKKYIVVNDLGVDKIFVYKYNPTSTDKILEQKSIIETKPGSGPRHLTFSNDGKFVYVLGELDGNISSYKYSNGNLRKMEETTLLPKDFKGKIGAADIHISPNGKFLYATNRGDANTISTFAINKKGGLNIVNHSSTKGKSPRNFVIDPTGKFLLVANQDSNNVVIFRIDPQTGKLVDTGKRIEVCSPVCLVFGKQ
ncbi:beta-propeller fold lactonase family protein [Flavobacterium sp. NST-5]|uniref:Beta-propeller fold lactonase family protein n=1 Tax=Flavobacterium ichthyis TaxID=2698827 RepID=A0ABW9Z563_9FLAO|nr:lactonase family protein [Flavobacterium ichthyis]NBL63978.1 beta-propeller fold lactonase family protein [Flavobacterium ichthyis]